MKTEQIARLRNSLNHLMQEALIWGNPQPFMEMSHALDELETLQKENTRLTEEASPECRMVGGYLIEDVIIMAQMLKEKGITPVDCHEYAQAFKDGYKKATQEAEAAIRRSMRIAFGENENGPENTESENTK